VNGPLNPSAMQATALGREPVCPTAAESRESRLPLEPVECRAIRGNGIGARRNSLAMAANSVAGGDRRSKAGKALEIQQPICPAAAGRLTIARERSPSAMAWEQGNSLVIQPVEGVTGGSLPVMNARAPGGAVGVVLAGKGRLCKAEQAKISAWIAVQG